MNCKKCGTKMEMERDKVYTSLPPQYGFKCPKCGAFEYSTTPEYDDVIGDDIMDVITGKNEKPKNAVEQMIGFLSSPIARRKGVRINADECKIWVEELENFMSNKQN